ncbi:hypothetical protein EMIT0194P_20525 [Pseudomonas serbica]
MSFSREDTVPLGCVTLRTVDTINNNPTEKVVTLRDLCLLVELTFKNSGVQVGRLLLGNRGVK